MKAHRHNGLIAIMFGLSLILMSGCTTLGLGSGAEGDGAFDEIDLSDDGGEGDVEQDEIDLSSGCPQEEIEFWLTLDYQLNVEQGNGYIRERTDPTAGVSLIIRDSDVWMRHIGLDSETIPGTIEGQIGDCQVEGMTELSFIIVGSCESGMATLDITGQYELYSRRIVCNGQVVENFTDSLIDGPSITADFNISLGGDTVDWSQDLGFVQAVYKWTLAPLGSPALD